MKRRGFLGFLGGAVAAGPAMAKQAVVGIEAMALPTLGFEGPDGPYPTATCATDDYNHADWLRERIAELTGITAEERKERVAGTSVSTLDADLAVNRAFSLQMKIEIQKRRNVDRYIERERRGYQRELAEYLKRQILS